MSNLVNSRVPLELFFGETGKKLAKQIKDEQDDKRRIVYLEEFMLSGMANAINKPSIIDEAIELMDTYCGCISVEEVAEKLKISKRYLETGTGVKQTSANAYLFLEIPVTYHYKLTNSTKLPLYVNVGISANALLYKNALLFDQSNFVFYKGTNQYNNFQVHATFGFDAQLQLNKKYALQLAPQLKYGLTNISNDKKTYGRQHFLQYGLQANLLFSKK
ncbi:MAG TPA: hypothetical protein PL045_10490, partial [Chitinophagaceae bacterium]|nr:hypothetical protein [Chitinophagaceae bacterium]